MGATGPVAVNPFLVANKLCALLFADSAGGRAPVACVVVQYLTSCGS